MTPTLNINGREIPIAGFEAVWIEPVNRFQCATSVEYRDVATCGHCHADRDEAACCADDLAEADRQRSMRERDQHTKAYPAWQCFRIQPVRELPDEHLEEEDEVAWLGDVERE